MTDIIYCSKKVKLPSNPTNGHIKVAFAEAFLLLSSDILKASELKPCDVKYEFLLPPMTHEGNRYAVVSAYVQEQEK